MDLHWHDFVRIVAVAVSLYSFCTLVNRWRKNRHTWNTKTLDYWYALVMWSLAGIVIPFQSVILNRPFTPGFVFLIAAILVTGKGVHQKGEWGANSASKLQ